MPERARDEHVRVELEPAVPGDPELLPELRRRADRVLVKGNLQQLVLSSDIDRLVGLGGLPVGQRAGAARSRRRAGADGPCGQLGAAKPVKVVFGPGTFINESAEQIDEQLTAQTKQAEAAGEAGRSGRSTEGRAGARAKAPKRRSSSASRRARSRSRASRRASRRSALAVRAHRAAEPRRPELRLDAGVRLDASRRARPSRASPTCSPTAKRRLISVRLKAGSERSASGRARSR